jgi:hypothetical protein
MVQPGDDVFHIVFLSFLDRSRSPESFGFPFREVARFVPACTLDNAERTTLFHEIFFGKTGINRKAAGLLYAGV